VSNDITLVHTSKLRKIPNLILVSQQRGSDLNHILSTYLQALGVITTPPCLVTRLQQSTSNKT
jgi:hypothetical protein